MCYTVRCKEIDMKYFIYGVNCLLAFLFSIILFTGIIPKQSKTIVTEVAIKQLQSGILKNIRDTIVEEVSTSSPMQVGDVSAERDDSLVSTEDQKDIENSISSDAVEDGSSVPSAEESVSAVSDVLETQIGKMSGYGPDCIGCSGYLASGKYVGDGTIFYSDPTYGNVRILAGDSQYPFGTIVRVKNSRLSEFLGIVLDRGGAIGHGKTFLFDLIYASEALAYQDEVSYNVTFEILRYGY